MHGLRDPSIRLADEDIEVRRGGSVEVEADVRLADDATVKNDITLILDISASLTAQDLEDVKASATDLVIDLLPVARTLRIYEFASPSETRLVGVYEVGGDPATGFAWSPSPIADIDAIDGGSNSTALFHAVRTAIRAEPDDVIVLFSDGQENSSPAGAREEARMLVDDNEVVVFSVGFGSVDADDLRALSSPFGRFFGVRRSLVGLFDEIGRAVRSIYTLVYDTPSSFGAQTLDVRIEAEGRRFRFETTPLAGVDLARAAIGRFPTMPGSAVVLHDFRTDPPSVLSYVVFPLEDAVRRDDGLLTFAVVPSVDGTSPACVGRLQGVRGAGAVSANGDVFVPEVFEEGTTWTDASTDGALTFLRFAEPRFFDGTGNRRRYRCAEIAFAGGVHCFAPEIGLVRTTDPDGNILVELAEPPCLSGSFTGGCTVE